MLHKFIGTKYAKSLSKAQSAYIVNSEYKFFTAPKIPILEFPILLSPKPRFNKHSVNIHLTLYSVDRSSRPIAIGKAQD